MRDVRPVDPFRTDPDPLPHFAPFFPDRGLRETWELQNARRAEAWGLFAPPNVGFHHNPMESDVSYLYVAESPNHPGEVKIGISRNRPDGRIKESARDAAFRKDADIQISAFFMMKNIRSRDVETAVHKVLSGVRSESLMGEKEWFRISPQDAMFAVELAARHYADPGRIRTLSDLVGAWGDPAPALILDDLVPEMIGGKRSPVTGDPGWKTEKAQEAARLFSDLCGVSLESRDQRGYVYHDNLVFVPVVPAPDRYYWDAVAYLIPLRANLTGGDLRLPGIQSLDMEVPSLDVSVPEHAGVLRNRFAVGHVSGFASLDLSPSLGSNPHDGVMRSVDQLFETDVVNAPIMSRITGLYWEVRDLLDRALPQTSDDTYKCGDRDKYLHFLSARLVAARPDEVTPRKAQNLHAEARGRAGTPADMSVCPVELCEITRPILERSGRTAKMRQDREEPGPD